MKELYTIELDYKEWVEIRKALNSLKNTRMIIEDDEKKANLDKEIIEKIHNQLLLKIKKSTN